jgi:hypothetical protein
MKYRIIPLLIFIGIFSSCTDKDPVDEIDPLAGYDSYSFNLVFSPLTSDIVNPAKVELIITDKENGILLDTILDKYVQHTINYKSPEEKINLTYIEKTTTIDFIVTYFDFSPMDWAISSVKTKFNYPCGDPPQEEESEASTLRLINGPVAAYNLEVTSGGYSSVGWSDDLTVDYQRRISGEYFYYAADNKQFFLGKLTSSDTTISLDQTQDLTELNYHFNVDYPLKIFFGSITAFPEVENRYKSLIVYANYDNLFEDDEIYYPQSTIIKNYYTTITSIDENRNEHLFFLSADHVPDQLDMIDKSDIIVTNTSLSEFSLDFSNLHPSYYSTVFKNDSVNVIQFLPPEINTYSPDSLISAIKNSSFLLGENLDNLTLSQLVIELADTLDYPDFITRVNHIDPYDSEIISSIKRLTIKY